MKCRVVFVDFLHRDLRYAEQDDVIETEEGFFIHTGPIKMEHTSDLGIFELLTSPVPTTPTAGLDFVPCQLHAESAG